MSPEMLEFFRLAPLGLLIGAYGTLVGAGGGSVLVPALLFLYPEESPATITAMSLAVVFFNAYSGTVAYMRMGRIDYRCGVAFTVASLPCAVIGSLLVHEMPRHTFDLLFGLLLLSIGALLVSNPLGGARDGAHDDDPITNRQMLVGSVGSSYIAVLASLLGLGGGVIHVPFLIRVMRMPAHMATATSHFVLTFIALTATTTHVVLGEFDHGLARTMYLAVGVMMGAPIGASLSTKLKGSLIIRLLAMALCVVGVRLLWRLM